MESLERELTKNTYPGRGIIVGKSQDGSSAVVAYFIMGRSENSRNRIFLADKEGLKTQAFDPSKMTDPGLIIYSPVRILEDCLIVSNGDQTDTICEGLLEGKTFEESLRERTFEPDAPNYTPRISALVDFRGEDMRLSLSILKSDENDGSSCIRNTYTYDRIKEGSGRFIHTYREDGNPLLSFRGEPKKVEIKGDIEQFSQMLWQSLNEENKISLFVRYIDLKSKRTETKIINKNQ